MELRQLRYFVTVAATRSFSDAARKLFITQGTLSQQIKQLEDEMGVQLLARTSHSVMLTEAGEKLLPLAKETIDSAINCRNMMIDMRSTVSGVLNIGLTHSFSGLLTDTIKTFVRQYPHVELNLQCRTASELMEMLQEKVFDIVLAFKPFKVYENIESETLFSSQLSVVVRKEHPLAQRKVLNMDELSKQNIVMPGSGLQARRAFDRFIGIDTKELNVRIELNDPSIIMDLVQETNMVAIVSSLAAYYRPNLVAIPFENGRYDMLGCIHCLKDGYRKRAAGIFIDMLKNSPFVSQIASWR